MSGPPPDPNARRRNKRKIATTVIDGDTGEIVDESVSDEDAETLPEIVVPSADPNWHWRAQDLYQSFVDSAVNRLYEPTDWQNVQMLCEDYSRELKPRKVQIGTNGAGEPIFVEQELPIPGAKLNAYIKVMNGLLADEGSRRRMQVQVKRAGQVQHGKDSQTVQQRVVKDRLQLLQGGETG